MKILIATGNAGKKKMFDSFFKALKNFEFVSLKDFPAFEEPVENGSTYAENAALKARYYAQKTGLPTIAEDSGLELEALPDKFGLKTKREIDAPDDIEWLRLFLDMLEDEPNRNGKFVSAMALFNPDTNDIYEVQGDVRGEITEFPAAPIEKGVPISAVFLPEGELEVFSAMSAKKRNEVSHRGHAMMAMKEVLENL
ncbi:hypothetical protein CSB37_00945 [bacterium DOLZORAL124_38_8]|nr:MAG: hypothetical protein CSB37_00945 [bacterium DOLZORAL124_38_8]